MPSSAFSGSLRSETRRIISLAWPLLIGQLAVISNGVIDTAMTSRYSATDLAALALGASIYISVFVGLNGVLAALSPIVGQLYGAQRLDEIGSRVKQGMWLAGLLTVIGAAFLLFPQPLLAFAHASPELSGKATLYLRSLVIALPATMGFRIYMSLNTAIGRPKMVMALQIGGVFLKLPLNALFIYGGFGLPAMGGPGCAIATGTISWLLFITGWTILRRGPSYRRFGIFGTGFAGPSWPVLKELLRLGIPMGLSYFIEVTAFAFMALFIARIGDAAVAGHQVTANFASVLYMLPLSIANATGTLAAQALGARQLDGARRIGNAGIRLAVGVSIALGVVIWFGRGLIVHAYTPDATIASAAMPLFTFIAVYQVFDAVQVVVAFVLRAYKVALVPTVIYAVALWGVGLGGGYVLGLNPLGISPPFFQGASGFWMGNSTSLAVVAGGLLWYLKVVQRDLAAREKGERV
ncbi:MATE family efflux transporter [Noviherbaspirillum galbum]|uniref:MATE family efflux transporter n=1 Tax=Noviherbaspirillum galbum TaxID=2709383 RepID=UPI002E2852B8|nr:MATE family efflux transporter [Noviherbaspirillum galbum]